MFAAIAVFIQSLLDTLLPRKERVVRIDHYTLEDIPVSPRAHDACGIHITTLLNYRTHVTQDLIRALKYNHSGIAAKLLAGALAEYLREEIANRKLFSPQPIILIPIPLHSTRQRERGFNQIEKVLENLPQEFKNGTLSRVETQVLVRTRATSPQTKLSREKRLENMQNAFSVSDLAAIRGAHIILIDDVTTTGATLAEAARPLKKESVSLIALAHA